jgi:hypothetical protein
MALLEAFRSLEGKNEPGHGAFEIKIKEGNGKPQILKVPVLNFKNLKGTLDSRDYFKAYLKKNDAPIIALRYGPQGGCEFVVNPHLIRVESMGERLFEIYNKGYWNDTWSTEAVNKNKFYKNHFFQGGPRRSEPREGFKSEFIELEGTAINGLKVKAYVYFQPSGK